MNNTFLVIIGAIPPLLFSVILHEIAHGRVAEHFGDLTARRLGRITLNPIKHIDPVMTVIFPGLLIFFNSPIIFGGAKPVPVNPLNFRNPRRDMAYVALAGPATNLVLAILCYLGLNLFAFLDSLLPVPQIFYLWLAFGVLINMVLAVFNLLPVPPLDGGRIAVGFLPLSLAKSWARLEPFGLLIVMVLLFSGVLDKVLGPVLEFIGFLPLLG